MELTEYDKQLINEMRLTPDHLRRLLEIKDRYELPGRGGYDGIEEDNIGSRRKDKPPNSLISGNMNSTSNDKLEYA